MKRVKLKGYGFWRRINHASRCLLGLAIAIPIYAICGFFRSFGAMAGINHYNLIDLSEDLSALYAAAWSMLMVAITGYATAKQARSIHRIFPEKIRWDDTDEQPKEQP